MDWQTRKILIYGKTYPEISTRYVETVCTGGIFEEDGSFVRLYPIPFRYLEEGRQFKTYQWISARITRGGRDQRPESYKVDLESIETFEIVDTGPLRDWAERKRLFLRPGNVFGSLEELRARQEADGTSIGMIRPKAVQDFYIEKKEKKEYEKQVRKRDEILSQGDMFRGLLDHEVPDFKFFFKFTCDDPACRGHDVSVLDWGFYELYRKTRGDTDWFGKMKQKVMGYCDSSHETYFFMGNLADPACRNVFCVSGLFYPKKTGQLALL